MLKPMRGFDLEYYKNCIHEFTKLSFKEMEILEQIKKLHKKPKRTILWITL